jgi:CRISPR-associated protein Csx14
MVESIMTNSSTLIATLGSEAQVITLTLELLLARGYNIRELIVVHTLSEQEPVRSALARLHEFFSEARRDRLIFRPVMIGAPTPIADLVTEDEVGALFRTLYREVLAAKRAGKTVHLSIAGGRKTMAVYGMAVAQMLFDDDDHLWHLLSTGKILEERRMQSQPGDEVKLIPIPVLRWSAVSPVLTDLARHDDPWEALQEQRQLRHRAEWQRKKDFVERVLTRAEREVVGLLVREGLSNEAIARRLHRSVRTVGNHLSHVYDKLHEFLGFREDVPTDRQVVIAELASVFLLNLPHDKSWGKEMKGR